MERKGENNLLIISWITGSAKFCRRSSFSNGIVNVRGKNPYLLSPDMEPFEKITYSAEDVGKIPAESIRNGGSLNPWEWQTLWKNN